MRVDISPGAFASLTLPVYKALFEASAKQGRRAAATVFNHNTSASFGRVLALAGQTLRLGVAHFEAAQDAIVNASGLVLAPKLQPEQVRLNLHLSLHL